MKAVSKQAKNLLDEDLKEETAFDGWTYFGDKGDKNLKVPYILRQEEKGVKEAWWLMSEFWVELLDAPSLKILTSMIMNCVKKGYVKKENVITIDVDKTALNHAGICELLAFCPNAHPHLKRYFLKEEAKAEPAVKYGNMQGKPSPELVEAFGRIKIPGLEKSESLPVPVSAPIPQSPAEISSWYFSEKIRTWIQPDDSKWFCAVDVCKALGYRDTEQAIKSHCLDRVGMYKSEDGVKEIAYVSESDLYQLLLRSDSIKAIPLRNFTTRKVLPDVRKYGKFSIPREAHEKALQEMVEALPSQGEQLELFLIPSKPDLTFTKPVVKILSLALKHLADNGTTFKTHADFLGYLLKRGIKDIGLEGFELNENGGK